MFSQRWDLHIRNGGRMGGWGSGVVSRVILPNLPLVKVLIQGFGAHEYLPTRVGWPSHVIQTVESPVSWAASTPINLYRLFAWTVELYHLFYFVVPCIDHLQDRCTYLKSDWAAFILGFSLPRTTRNVQSSSRVTKTTSSSNRVSIWVPGPWWMAIELGGFEMPDLEMASHSLQKHLTNGSRKSWIRAKKWTTGTAIYADWRKNLQTVFPGQPARNSHLTGRVGENCCAIEKARRPSLSILSSCSFLH